MARKGSRVIFVFFGLAIMLAVGVGALGVQYDDSVTDTGEETDIVNETFTVTNGATIELAESNRDVIYNQTVTVRNVSDANDPVVEPSGNYTWHESNGTITINATSTFNDGDTAGIDYTFWVPRDSQTYVRDIGLEPFRAGDDLMLVLAVAFVAVALLHARGRV